LQGDIRQRVHAGGGAEARLTVFAWPVCCSNWFSAADQSGQYLVRSCA
jgi:hypothetical protein